MNSQPRDGDHRAEDTARLLSLLDLTSLGDDDQTEDIDRLCRSATTNHGPVAAVCVWPRFVAEAVERLSGSGIPVAAVANFPDGADDPTGAAVEAGGSVEAGAGEIDVVVPWRSLVAGDDDVVHRLVAATRETVGDAVVVKAILETGELDDPGSIRRAALEALSGGADFLKTSTGKTGRSATPEAARILLDVIRQHEPAGSRPVGLKLSGGIRTVDQALGYVTLARAVMGPDWITPDTVRFGASSLLADILTALEPAGGSGRQPGHSES